MLAVRIRSLALVALIPVLMCASQAFWPQDSGASTATATESGQAATSTEEAEGVGSGPPESSAEASSPTTPGSGAPEASSSTPPVVEGSKSSTSTSPSRPSVATQLPQAQGRAVTQTQADGKATPQTQADGKAKPVATQKGGGTAGAQASTNPAEPSTLAPSPGALFPASLAFTASSPLLNLFLDTYRTPPFLLPIYLAAAQRYGIPWEVLAAINEVESNYGFDLGPSSAGAEGWMQFLPEEWLAYGVDANGAGVRDPNNPADAIFATARYLAAAGAATNLRGAIYAYNHSSGYVESVIVHTELIADTPQSLINSLAAIVSGRFPVEGGGPHSAAAVWSKAPQPGTAHSADAARSSEAGALAPAPAVAAAGSASAAGPTVTGASLTAEQGAAVVAVQHAEVLQTGRSARLGRFIELRDAYGDTYTYAHLGRVLKRYALAQATPDSRTRAYRGASNATLRAGTWVAAGTVLGNVPSGASGAQVQFLFEIAPPGAGKIDPRPVLQGWQLLGETQGNPQEGAQPLFGPDAGDALINEIQLLSEQQLQAHLLSNSQLRLDVCGEQDIGAGRIERPVLATLDFLLASGVDPTVSGLPCVHDGVASTAEHVSDDTLTITALNGVPIRGHDGPGSLIEVVARGLLALPAAVRPHQMLGPLSLAGTAQTPIRRGSPDDVEISFSPPAPEAKASTASPSKQTPGRPGATGGSLSAGAKVAAASSAARLAPDLGTEQWRKLIARISGLAEPHVPRAPTSAAVADNPSSPLPTAGALFGSLPLPSSGSPPPATVGQTGAGASHLPLQPSPAGSKPGSNAPYLALTAPPATPLLAEAGVVLETPEITNGILLGEATLVARTTGLLASSIASYKFEYEEVECEKPESSQCWTPFKETTQPSTQAITGFDAEAHKEGLYNLRVIVATASGSEYQAELNDQVDLQEGSPVVTLANPGTDLNGAIELHANWQPPQAIASISFQWALSKAEPGKGRWHSIAPGSIAVSNTSGAVVKVNPEELPNDGNGNIDFRVVPVDAQGTTHASIPVRKVLVDNKAPNVLLSEPKPGSSLSAQVKLSATAEDAEAATGEPGSGVASVRFQARPEGGVGRWRDLGGETTNPDPSEPNTYSRSVSTESLQNGTYEFRAIAEDKAGNEALSPSVPGIQINNETSAPSVSASVSGVVAPAQEVHFLGTVAANASPQNEAEVWAYGFTRAPPAEVDGHELEYTAQGKQLVLLRNTQKGGWQIAGVPQLEEGKAFNLLPANEVSSIQVAGAMTTSGEAWLWVGEASTKAGQPPVVGLFHRVPTGQFVLDRKDTTALGSLLGSEAELNFQDGSRQAVGLRLGESAGHVYGMVTAPAQTEQRTTVKGVSVKERLEYGLLKEGEWTRTTATPPPLTEPSVLTSEPLITLRLADLSGPEDGWGAFEVTEEAGDIEPGRGLVLGHLQGGVWSFSPTGLDALDLTGAVAEKSERKGTVTPEALKAAGKAVWIEAKVSLTNSNQEFPVVARYEEGEAGATGSVTDSWCSLPVENHCEEPLDPEHPAAVPDAVFGAVALALKNGFVDVFDHREWTTVAAPGYGYSPSQAGEAVFAEPNEGWLGGTAALGHWSDEGTSSLLASWPLPDRAPLTSVALPSGTQGDAGESGALAVGFDGTTLSYDASAGWLVQPVPSRARRLNLLSVAFAGPSSAFAVGQFGLILHWNGTAWSEDPQSISLTQSQLNAVAFAPSGQEGWAVGSNGTILHYDGQSWSREEPPASDADFDITSVTVAGSEVFAIANGSLITRSSTGAWVAAQPPGGGPSDLTVVAGLPDGGVVVAGNSVVLVRQEAPTQSTPRGGETFQDAAQPLQGIAVALAPFREPDGNLRAYVSVAQPAFGQQSPPNIAGFPAGDGELLRQTSSGWQDLSRAQYAGGQIAGDGAIKSDPVLGVTTGPAGEHAWAVGGYDGTEDAARQGSEQSPATRSPGWQTASIWRYDTAGSAQPSEVAPSTPSLPAKPNTVSFAFFTSPMCREECSAVVGAQPSVNLTSAAKQIAAYQAQGEGGPAFAMLGGNAVGPLEQSEPERAEKEEADFSHLPELLAPLGDLPTFAALGRFDNVPGRQNESLPWAEAFADAPAPFGSGPNAPGITPVSSGAPTGEAHHYYAFDATQNGGRLRVIALDNSKGSLEASDGGQMAWLRQQLASANEAGTPIVVITALPLRPQYASDGEEVAELLAESGVLAVFTTGGALQGNSAEVHELDEHHLVPENPGAGVAQIPEYEGASLGYQQTENNGVMWYFVSIDTQARAVKVAAIPVVDSLSLKAVDGLSAARSRTLQFDAVGRRPAGTLATTAVQGTVFQGFDDYVEIPAPSCGKLGGGEERPCVKPSYTFASSNPIVGNFVEPSGEGSSFPKTVNGHPVASSTSGLFCAYNSGTTTVSVTAGLLSYSLPITVQPGGFGPPCGTVPGGTPETVIVIHSSHSSSNVNSAAAPPPPPPAVLSGVSPSLNFLPPPPAVQPAPPAVPPAAKPAPPPAPAPTPEPPPPPPAEQLSPVPLIVPGATPPVEPIPPGGAAQAPSTAKREEKARKHASQSAFAIRPAGATWFTSGEDWFYTAVAGTALLALLLAAQGLRARPGPRPALLFNRSPERERRRR
jgi:Transglycosylase SLT domain